MAKRTFTVRTSLIHERKIYTAGEPITLTDDRLASTLLKRGQIVQAPEPTPPPPPPPPPPEKPPAPQAATPKQQQQPPGSAESQLATRH